MLAGVIVVIGAGACAAAAGYVMWWASHRSTLVSICVGMLLALLAFVTAIFIGLMLMRSYTAPLNPL